METEPQASQIPQIRGKTYTVEINDLLQTFIAGGSPDAIGKRPAFSWL